MQLDPGWYSVLGLTSNAFGSCILASGLFIGKQQAIELSVSRYSDDPESEQLKLPQVRDRLRQSSKAKVGLAFLLLGNILQVLGTSPP